MTTADGTEDPVINATLLNNVKNEAREASKQLLLFW